MSYPRNHGVSRRSFLRTACVVGAGAALADAALAQTAQVLTRVARPRKNVRVRGTVAAGGKGVPRVAVTDGVTVVPTAADGSFDLLTDTSRPFVFLTVPSGYRIPTSPHGTASFYAPLSPGGSDEVSLRWDLERLPGDDANHAFLLLADPQTLDSEDMAKFNDETIPDIRSTLAGMAGVEVFGVSCGDIMFDRLGLFPDYEKAIARTGIPFLQVLGNHDVDALARTDELSAATFMRHFGPPYYSFERGEVHYVVMDDVMWLGDGYIGYIDHTQLEWLAADLALVERGRTVAVFMHIPSFTTQHTREGRSRPDRSIVVANRAALNDVLAPYRAHIIAGHMHELEHVTDGPVPVHVVGAVCGAWWTGPICGDGTPSGYGVYDVRGSEIRWRYKGTGLPAETQMRVYPSGTDPAAPGDIIVNAWDYDQAWVLAWYEDGMRKGLLTQRRGTDPLSERLHTGPKLPSKHPWVEPYVTDHLFRCFPPAGHGTITIEATDRWGRKYLG